ncbi:MAG: prenyltransferase, partial [Candidatus Diapherotrites archaeon]|nr:prenyltransferase [Candidatus Diapherotrites archaeon]
MNFYLKELIELGRIRFLLGGILLFLLGFILNSTTLNLIQLPKLLIAYSIIFFGHLSISYSNNFFDVKTDKTSQQTLFSGGTKILSKKPFLKSICLKIAIFLTLISLILAIYFLYFNLINLEFFILVLLGNFFAWAYSASPLNFSYKGLGEISTTISFGLILPLLGAFAYSQTLSFELLLFLPSLLLLGLIFIISVELPDAKNDALNNKNTLIVKKGIDYSIKLILISFILILLNNLIIYLIELNPINFLLNNLLLLPIIP